jgi:Fe-S-cluster-containing hydrogenase component 2
LIIINAERCTGCGECIAACPTAALYLVDGKASLDAALCSECATCLAACPNGAIALSTQQEPVAAAGRMPARSPEPEIVLVETHPSLPLRARALPIVGTALAWVANEIVPRLAGYWLDGVDRRVAQQQATGSPKPRAGLDPPARRSGGGRRRRRRRRGS